MNENLEAPQTPLDEALQSVLKDRKYTNFFYDTFLNATVFLPVQKEGTQEGSWQELDMQDRFFPYFLSFENGRAIPVFDTLDRLKDWAQNKTLDYLKIKTHVLLKILDPKMAVLINAGTSFHYTLTSEILEVLRSSMKPVTPV